MKKFLDNKFVKLVMGIVKAAVWIAAILIVVVIVTQRVFDNKAAVGDYRIFTIATGSMIPVYNISDVILVGSKDYDKIKVGDDLVYMGEKETYKGKIITHRVINIENKDGTYYYTTKGVNNPLEDPVVSEKQVYGVVLYKTIFLSFFSHILNNSFGFYFLIFVPIALLIFLEILDYIKGREEKLNDESGREQE